MINSDFQLTAWTLQSRLLSALQVSALLKENTYMSPSLRLAVMLAITALIRGLRPQRFVAAKSLSFALCKFVFAAAEVQFATSFCSCVYCFGVHAWKM